MDYSNFEGKIKNIIYHTYDNVFNFDIKNATNGGNKLNVVVTLRTSISQLTPMRIEIVLERISGKYTTKRIYVTRNEKLAGLREAGRVDEFISRFLDSEWEEEDITKFIEDNEDIIKDSDSDLERTDVENLLKITKEQKIK